MRVAAPARIQHLAPDGVAVDARAELRERDDARGVEVRLNDTAHAIDEPREPAQEIALGESRAEGGQHELLSLRSAVVVRIVAGSREAQRGRAVHELRTCGD